MAAFLIILSTCTSLAEGLLIKRYNKSHEKGGFIFTSFISLFSMLFFLITDSGNFNVPATLWVYAIIAGILYSSASLLTYIALGCGSFALSMLILSYALIIPTGYGLIFLCEKPTLFTYFGFALIIISLFLVRAKKQADNKNVKISAKWVICIGISFLFSGLFSVLTRLQQIKFNDTATNEFMTIALSISFVCLFIIGLLKSPKDFTYVLRHGFLYTLGAGLSNGVTNMLGLLLVSEIIAMPISIASPVRAGAKIIVSFLLSAIILKEKFEKRQVIGVILGGLAIVCLNIKV
jgi:drug/metabolite transporter (DMT)-like permease